MPSEGAFDAGRDMTVPKRRLHSAKSRPLEQQTQPEGALGNRDKVFALAVSVSKAEKFQGYLNEQLKNVIKDHVLSMLSLYHPQLVGLCFHAIQMAANVASILYSHQDTGRPKTTPTLHPF